MRKAFFITIKEVRDFLRDKGDLSFSLLLPILIFALMLGVFGGDLQFNGTAYIVNEDPGGRYSSLLIDRLRSFNGLTVQTISRENADSRLSRSNIQFAVYIPAGFSAELAASKDVQLTFKQRGNGGTEGQIVANLVRGAAEEVIQELQVQNQVKNDIKNTSASPQQIQLAVQQILSQESSSPSIKVSETALGSNPDPVNQFLPGILTMFVLFSINLTAQSLVEERRKGTLERLITTRLTTGQLFSGKFMAYTARAFVQTLILLLLAYAVFRIFTPVSFLEALVVALVFGAAASTLGLIIGSIARTENQAIWIAVFFTMVMVMLSGTFMPISEGTFLYTLSRFSLNTYASDAFRALISQGGSLADIKVEILVMLGVVVVGLFISRLLFRVTQGGK
jgi:ABC-2 type transport system permease protein